MSGSTCCPSNRPSGSTAIQFDDIMFDYKKELKNAYEILNQYASKTDLIQYFFREIYILFNKDWKPDKDILSLSSDNDNYNIDSLYHEVHNVLSAFALYCEKYGQCESEDVGKNIIKNIIDHKPLTPLKFDEKEFESIPNDTETLQNIRLHGIIKKTYKPDTIYDVHAFKGVTIGYYDLSNDKYQSCSIHNYTLMNPYVPICFWKEKEKRWFLCTCLCKVKNKKTFKGEFRNTSIPIVEVNNIPNYLNGIYIASYDDIPRIFFRDYELRERIYDNEPDTFEFDKINLEYETEYINVCNMFSDKFVDILKNMYE